MNTVKEPATHRGRVHGSNNSECYHPYELTPTQGQNRIEREHTNTRNVGKEPGTGTQGHSSPPQRSRIKEKDGEQASTQLLNPIPAEHTTTIALLS